MDSQGVSLVASLTEGVYKDHFLSTGQDTDLNPNPYFLLPHEPARQNKTNIHM